MSDTVTINDVQPFKGWLRGLVGCDRSNKRDPTLSAIDWAHELDVMGYWHHIPDGHSRLIDAIRQTKVNIESFAFAWHAWTLTLGELQCCHQNCSNSFLAHDAQLRYCSRQCAPNDHFLWRAYHSNPNHVVTLDAIGRETKEHKPQTVDPEGHTFRGWLLLIKQAERMNHIYKTKDSGKYLTDFTSHIAFDVEPGDTFPASRAVKLTDVFTQTPFELSEAAKAAFVFAWCEYAEFVQAKECAADNCSRPIVSGSKQVKYCSDKCRETYQRLASREYHRQRRREELNGALKRIIKEAKSLKA